MPPITRESAELSPRRQQIQQRYPATAALASHHRPSGQRGMPVSLGKVATKDFLGGKCIGFSSARRDYHAGNSSMEPSLAQSHAVAFKNRCSFHRPITKFARLFDLAEPIELTPLESRGQV
jgi:hypothetical protein